MGMKIRTVQDTVSDAYRIPDWMIFNLVESTPTITWNLNILFELISNGVTIDYQMFLSYSMHD